jgi:arsenate reductase-like glutaredoxin family protein
LRELGLEVEEINFAKTPLDEASLRMIVKAAGGVMKVANLRHAVAKENGWAEEPPSEDAFVEAALAEPNVMRRPILVLGKKVLVGFDKSNKDLWAKLG